MVHLDGYPKFIEKWNRILEGLKEIAINQNWVIGREYTILGLLNSLMSHRDLEHLLLNLCALLFFGAILECSGYSGIWIVGGFTLGGMCVMAIVAATSKPLVMACGSSSGIMALEGMTILSILPQWLKSQNSTRYWAWPILLVVGVQVLSDLAGVIRPHWSGPGPAFESHLIGLLLGCVIAMFRNWVKLNSKVPKLF